MKEWHLKSDSGGKEIFFITKNPMVPLQYRIAPYSTGQQNRGPQIVSEKIFFYLSDIYSYNNREISEKIQSIILGNPYFQSNLSR